ncbi:MFS transporter [Cupriavidus respiraculi]|uniref:YbfB/YjiJ family MFS transporter n=1 Tax=Cupriavidus respiraculi TaxID=195930 RepID=UPI001C960917|nr:YbfB/YjiJ family MFS transporter [Cupriavidus respiraculi]MBY4948116.1 MFS transporter [Cupriavidus respiraculi]
MHSASSSPAVRPGPAPTRHVWLYIAAGFAASLASIGLARFAYAPLVPALIEAHWFSADKVVFLGAANLAGYLIGALVGHPLGRRMSNPRALRTMMVVVTAAFVACAYPLSSAWFFFWRLLSGVSGGAIMVLVAATVLPHVPAQRRGIASGAIFLGIGVGIAGSGTIVPLLLHDGLRTTWLGLGAVSALLTVLTWFAWPSEWAHADAPANGKEPAAPAAHGSPKAKAGVAVLFAQYGLMAVALVPAMVFLVDFVARGLGAGAHVGAGYWVLYGIGAMMGPPLFGWIGDRLGARPALRVVLLVQAVAVGSLCAAHDAVWLGVATVFVGMFPPGIVPLALSRIHELIPHDRHAQSRAWSRATISFATFQALAGYGYSAVFSATGGDHRLLFALATGALIVTLVLTLPGLERWVWRRLGGRQRPDGQGRGLCCPS